ncbi:MAG: class I SAM-dependent methyltransferase [Solirubrobacteraceae bacterium]
MAAPRTDAEIRRVNERYHDVAACSYDSKWGIDFGRAGLAQVRAKLEKALGEPLGHTGRSLEIGAGTGYFSLNLLLAGVVEQAVCTDISPGMLSALSANARRLGLEVETAVADAEALPFEEESFDLVLGHAVLHHLPDLERVFGELHRVLRAGGRVAFAGEPSRTGDRIARVPKRGALALAPLWRMAVRAGPAPAPHEDGSGSAEEHDLERFVDVHAFSPADLVKPARAAGFVDVRIRGEELLANWFGWTNRVLEGTAAPEDIPWAWRQYAYRGYLALQHLDSRLLEPRLPPSLFYNLLLSARRPA